MGESKRDDSFVMTPPELLGAREVTPEQQRARRLSDEWATWVFAGLTRFYKWERTYPNTLQEWQDLSFDEKKKWCNAASIAPSDPIIEALEKIDDRDIWERSWVDSEGETLTECRYCCGTHGDHDSDCPVGIAQSFLGPMLERCDTTLTERLPRENCTCDNEVDGMGPCEDWRLGQNGRCVYCDHTKACHSQAPDAQ